MSELLTRHGIFTDKRIAFRAYEVTIGIESEKKTHLAKVFRQLKKVFPYGLEKLSGREAQYLFYIKWTKEAGYELYRNNERVIGISDGKKFFDVAASQIRITVAEFARSKVFLHAGVVGWKNRAIVIPARSWSGKSTLVAELVRKGAVYYSDEYAVLDSNGNVQPFPKWISLRSPVEPYPQQDYPIESLGGTAGTETIPVGMVLITRFDKKKKTSGEWNPKFLSRGQGIMEILPHALPTRNEPEFVLKVLSKLTAHVIIVKIGRGEAGKFADQLLNYFESQSDKIS